MCCVSARADSKLHGHLMPSCRFMLHSQGCVMLRSDIGSGSDSNLLDIAAAVIVDGAT